MVRIFDNRGNDRGNDQYANEATTKQRPYHHFAVCMMFYWAFFGIGLVSIPVTLFGPQSIVKMPYWVGGFTPTAEWFSRFAGAMMLLLAFGTKIFGIETAMFLKQMLFLNLVGCVLAFQAVGLGPEIVNQTIFLIQGGAQIFILFFNLVFVCKLPAETRGTAMF